MAFDITRIRQLLKLSVLVVLFFIPAFCYSQVAEEIDKSLSVGKMKSRAADALSLGDVYTAIYYYEAIVEKEPKDLEVRIELADLYRAARNYAKAASFYAYVVEKDLQKYPMALYYKGIMLKMTGQYELAKQALLGFQKNHHHITDKEFLANLKREIYGCDSALIFKELPLHAKVQNVGKGINQAHAEFSPFLADSTHLLYGALRIDTSKYYNATKGNRELPVSQLFKAEKVNGKWEETGRLDIINDPHINMGHFAYSKHTNRYYFTKCEKSKKGNIQCKIYFSEKTKDEWTAAKVLPETINMEGYTSTHPAVGLDSASKIEYLYFVSDRPHGKGGLDIWYTHYNKHTDSWAHPINFTAANTPEIEFTPYYHEPTHTLYFSSNGHVSLGGLDIYKVKREGKKVSPTKDLSFPINSPQDDFDFILDDKGKSGFFVSNRPGGTPYFHETCCDDIFNFQVLPETTYDVVMQLEILLPDTSYCKHVHLYIKEHNITSGVTKTRNVELNSCSYRSLLKKDYSYTFKINPSGHDSAFVTTENVHSPSIIYKKLVVKKEILSKREVKMVSLKVKPKPNEYFILKDIQYEENESALNKEAIVMLDSLLIPFLIIHPKDTLYIHSYTDEVGADSYNNILSQQRADNVIKYLIEHGIEPARLIGKGHGKNSPIAPNENPDGSDNPEGRKLNRRTEFLLVKH